MPFVFNGDGGTILCLRMVAFVLRHLLLLFGVVMLGLVVVVLMVVVEVVAVVVVMVVVFLVGVELAILVAIGVFLGMSVFN